MSGMEEYLQAGESREYEIDGEGAMVPLALFPDSLAQVLRWLPFACLYDLPVRTLLGQVGLAEWSRALLLGGSWCGVFYLAGMLVWSRGERSYTGVGI